MVTVVPLSEVSSNKTEWLPALCEDYIPRPRSPGPKSPLFLTDWPSGGLSEAGAGLSEAVVTGQPRSEGMCWLLGKLTRYLEFNGGHS